MRRFKEIKGGLTEEQLYEAVPWLRDAKFTDAVVGLDSDYNFFWHDGTWFNGVWCGGTWHQGDWLGGIWYGGTWHDGTWRDGDWRDGDWQGGLIESLVSPQ